MALTKLNYTGQGTIPIASIPTITGTKMPAGSVIQTKQVVQNEAFNLAPSGSNLTDITGMSVDITPSSTSSKILISYVINAGYHTNYNGLSFYLCKGSTPITEAIGSTTNLGSRHSCTTSTGRAFNVSHMTVETFTFLDSPSTTSSLTYSLKIKDINGDGGQTRFNASSQDTDANYSPRGSSSITVQEIAG